MSFPPELQELRAKKIGHVLVDTKSDRPWSQYFSCIIDGNRDFVRSSTSVGLAAAVLGARRPTFFERTTPKLPTFLLYKSDNLLYHNYNRRLGQPGIVGRHRQRRT